MATIRMALVSRRSCGSSHENVSPPLTPCHDVIDQGLRADVQSRKAEITALDQEKRRLLDAITTLKDSHGEEAAWWQSSIEEAKNKLAKLEQLVVAAEHRLVGYTVSCSRNLLRTIGVSTNRLLGSDRLHNYDLVLHTSLVPLEFHPVSAVLRPRISSFTLVRQGQARERLIKVEGETNAAKLALEETRRAKEKAEKEWDERLADAHRELERAAQQAEVRKMTLDCMQHQVICSGSLAGTDKSGSGLPAAASSL
jgi:hypothetical protein